jgi:hypothetical protein
LRPDEAATLITGLTGGLAALAARPRVIGPDVTTVADLEARLARLEERRPAPWQRAVAAVTGWAVRRAVRARR